MLELYLNNKTGCWGCCFFFFFFNIKWNMGPVLAERFVVSVLGYIQNPTGHSSKQSCFKVERLDQVLFPTSAILWNETASRYDVGG